MAALSIVIPTHKRASLLKQCIEHLQKQTVADQLEIIVVSDGHDPATVEMVKDMPVKFFEIEKSQQGTARNKGVSEATTPLVLFIGDDLFLQPDACEKHINTHSRNQQPSAVLGFTTWDPVLVITPVMKWLEISGWQFGYPMISSFAHKEIPKEKQHLFSYTIHISVPTAVAKQFPFRTDITQYGWEDIAWGKELAGADIPLIYQPDAMGYHHHSLTDQQSLDRMETLGASIKHYPNLGMEPMGFKLFLYKIAAQLPTMAGRHRKAFLKGLKR